MSRALAFIPLRKIDEEQRLVYGIAAEEVLDRSGEIMDYETSAPLFKEWSDGIAEATGGSSLGNLRSMHQPIAAGKLTNIEFLDEEKQIIICAKVVDDAEWNKVLEGVYTGFSMGGSYAKKWKDPENPTITRYTGQPIEMSLVDLPCIPTAQFEVQKADGHVELRKFKLKEEPTMKIRTVTNEEVAARATEMAKAAEGTSWIDHLEPARAELEKAAQDEAEAAEAPASETPADDSTDVQGDVQGDESPADADAAPAADAVEPEEAPAEEPEITEDVAKTMVSQKWVAPDGSVHDKKDEAVAHVMGKTATPNPVQAALKAAKAALAGNVEDWPLGDAHEQVTKAHALLVGAQAARDASGELAKSFYSVKNLAEVLRDLGYATSDVAWCCESRDSAVPEQLAVALRATCSALSALAMEEVEETLAFLKSKGYDIGATEGVEKTILDQLTEIAGNDETMAKAASTLQKLAPPAPDGEVLTKMVTESPMFKALEADRDELKKQVGEAVDGIEELRKSIAALGKRPTEMAPRTSVVEKSAAEAPGLSVEAAKTAVAEMMKTPDGQRQLAEAAMRAQQGVAI